MGGLLDRWGLQYRITVSVSLGLGVILLLFAYVASWSVGQATAAALGERQALASTLARHVAAVLDDALGSLEVAAVTLGPDIDTGDQWAVERQTRVRDLARQLPHFTNLTVLDASGRLLLSEPPAPALTGTAVLDHPGAALTLQTQQRAIGEWPHQPAAAARGLCLSVPLLRRSGDGEAPELVGVLMADFDPDEAGMLLRLAGEPPDGPFRLELLDRGGLIAAASTAGRAHRPSPHVRLLEDLIAGGRPGVRPHHPPPSSGRAAHIVAYAPLALPAGLGGWGVTVEQDEDVALSLPHRLRDRMAAVGGIALVVASALAWLDVRRVVRPLRAVTAAAQRIAAGDLAVPLAGTVRRRRDEVGRLTAALETMRGRLVQSLAEIKEWNQQLEGRVRQRTHELAALEGQRRQLLSKVIWAQEEERKRLARELHDETVQNLSSVAVALEAIEARLPPHLAREREQLAWAQALAVHATREIRQLILDLRPSALDDLGLVPAVRWYAATHLEPLGVAVSVQAPTAHPPLRPALQTAAFRVLQEAIANAAKHARAPHVTIRIDVTGEALTAAVQDDGQGFDLAAVRAASMAGAGGSLAGDGAGSGLGLLGMAERVALLGGHLEVQTAPGTGTRVQFTIPLHTAPVPEPDLPAPEGGGASAPVAGVGAPQRQ